MSKALRVLLLVLVSTPVFASIGHRYHANALAVGGEGAPTVASVALAPAGGEAVAAAQAYDDGFVRFADAKSVVRGTRDEAGIAVTISEVIIRDVEIGGRIRADRLVVRVTGRHAPDARESELSFEGSAIENLTIDGVAVDAMLDTAWFSARPTFAAMAASGAPARFATISCSAFRAAVCGSARRAHAIHIPGLGALHIGEVFVRDGWRQINLLRLERTEFERTRPIGARVMSDDAPPPPAQRRSLTIGSGDGNGEPVWP